MQTKDEVKDGVLNQLRPWLSKDVIEIIGSAIDCAHAIGQHDGVQAMGKSAVAAIDDHIANKGRVN